MPRKKQDCPRRMKWEEEQALLAAAAAAAGQPLPPSSLLPPEPASDEDEEAVSETGSEHASTEHHQTNFSVAATSAVTPWECNGGDCSPRPSSVTSGDDARVNSPLTSNARTTVNEQAMCSDADDQVLDFSCAPRQRITSSSNSDASSNAGANTSSVTVAIRAESPLDLSVPKRSIDYAASAGDPDERSALPRGKRHRQDGDYENDAHYSDSPSTKFLSPWDQRSLALNLPAAVSSLSKLAAWSGSSMLPSVESGSSLIPPASAPPTSQKLPPYTKSPTPNEAGRALERMQELSKLAISATGQDTLRALGHRSSVWQNQWMSRSSEQTRDVLKCVWCKISFSSLAELTTHMREAGHTNMSSAAAVTSAAATTPPTTSAPSSSVSSEAANSLKETMPLPRKLVRGQDVWLGKGAEQTRQILKCMWCGQSFKSLDEMTVHMQKTQHYTNIISQEQIISWKSPDNKAPTAQSHVNAVLTCKVCDQAFSSLKELSSHMVKYSHYKEHIMRSISETGGRRRQTREKRKKSLPVRKLLELERAHNEMKSDPRTGSGEVPGRVVCDKCGDKVEPMLFVEHLKNCCGKQTSPSPRRIVEQAVPVRRDDEFYINSASSAAGALSDGQQISKNHVHEGDSAAQRSGTSGPRSALSALERLIETSLNPRQPTANSSTAVNMHRNSNGIGGGSILSRLGIEESELGRTSSNSERSGSYSVRPTSADSNTGSCASANTTEARCYYESDATCSETERGRRSTPLRSSAAAVGSVRLHETSQSPPVADESRASTSPCCSPVSHRVMVDSPAGGLTPRTCSPSGSERALTPRSERATSDRSTPAASAAAEDLSVALPAAAAVSSITGGSILGPANPLAALQKLCDKTDSQPAAQRQSSATTQTAVASTTGNPGAILAFSWACNDAVVSDSSLIKCAFCDTPFVSKGAYRHHLSKVHFFKDGVAPDAMTSGPSGAGGGGGNALAGKLSTSAVSVPAPSTSSSLTRSAVSSPSSGSSAGDDTPHSKFLKYTELAKQLSSKYLIE